MKSVAELLTQLKPLKSSEAALYEELAGDRVRQYLGYEPEESLARFRTAILTIALYMIDRDETAKDAPDGTVASEKFQEGSVSQSLTYNSRSALVAGYEGNIQATLNGLSKYRRPRVPGGDRDGADKA